MNFDPDYTLSETASRVGTPPRSNPLLKWRLSRGRKPSWLNSTDLISKIYDHKKQIIIQGRLRWAAVIHANNSLYSPGIGTSGAQVVYCPDGSASLEELTTIARNSFQTKNTSPDDPHERRLANMLTDEMERALNWPIPKTLSPNFDTITTIVMTPRRFMPRRVLALPYFPVLSDPDSLMAVMVPSAFWDAELRNVWKNLAKEMAGRHKVEHQPSQLHFSEITTRKNESNNTNLSITLTPAAGEKVKSIIQDASLDKENTCLRIGKVQGQHSMNLEKIKSLKKSDFSCRSCDILLVADNKCIQELQGTVIDYHENGSVGNGFEFKRQEK